MRLIQAVYDALRTFDRPATRAEIERESGLDKPAVERGLEGLDRRGDLVRKDVKPRKGGTYALKAGAVRPDHFLPRGKYSAARPPVSLLAAKTPKGKAKVIIGRARQNAHGISAAEAAAALE